MHKNKMTIKNSGLWWRMLSVALSLTVISCTNEVAVSTSEVDYDQPVVIRAATQGNNMATRTDGNEPEVEQNTPIRNRTLLFTYPSRPEGGKMKSLKVDFDGNGNGYVYTDEEKKQPLKWKDVYTGENNYPGESVDAVYLDNLLAYPVQEPDPNPNNPDVLKRHDNFTKIRFGPEGDWVDKTVDFYENKYKRMIAQVGTPKADTVDIIWGSISKPRIGKALEFELEHKMSAISFRFFSNEKTIKEQLQGGKIKVWLDNMRPWLEDTRDDSDSGIVPFNRRSGGIHVGGNYNFQKDIFLVKDGSLIAPEEPETSYYSTPVWIFPPFTFALSAGYTPQLTIELDGVLYVGPLPDRMNYWSLNQEGKWTFIESADIRFMVNYHLVFNVELVSQLEEREILFHAVEAFPWGGRFDENLTLKESGIYTWDDLVALSEVYKEDSSPQNYRLLKYGTWKDGKWIFKLWRHINVEEDTDIPKFNEGQFEIDFQTYSITVGGRGLKPSDFNE
ncbi:hypothetical protein NXY11_12575 [Parabacteroides faecis]|uniref:hypothetical protein n=1 Tax=Parabacteroides faecis TaxID=1217282 RepID=UPI0021645AA5|nr:hypothetical protein [Parabacteroides faecis]MCS2892349.1 hypothetical protein [Parabacteroides faecis]UVQ49011.1 hypothetical protein NXY11_12575 [Parabacteroides faecis]